LLKATISLPTIRNKFDKIRQARTSNHLLYHGCYLAPASAPNTVCHLHCATYELNVCNVLYPCNATLRQRKACNREKS
jgi:hypothetical protein